MESKLPRARCWHTSNLAFVPASKHPLFSPEQQAKQRMNNATPTSPSNGTSNLQLTTRGTSFENQQDITAPFGIKL
eukprot:2674052-Amphidinium_carterae.1